MLKALELTGKGENYSYGISKITDLDKEPVQTKESIAEDSPITLDTPPTLDH